MPSKKPSSLELKESITSLEKLNQVDRKEAKLFYGILFGVVLAMLGEGSYKTGWAKNFSLLLLIGLTLFRVYSQLKNYPTIEKIKKIADIAQLETHESNYSPDLGIVQTFSSERALKEFKKSYNNHPTHKKLAFLVGDCAAQANAAIKTSFFENAPLFDKNLISNIFEFTDFSDPPPTPPSSSRPT